MIKFLLGEGGAFMGLSSIIIVITITIIIIYFILMLNPKLRDKLFGKHIELTAKRIKKGFMEAEKSFCKSCGTAIDNDSKYCKSCGKEQ